MSTRREHIQLARKYIEKYKTMGIPGLVSTGATLEDITEACGDVMDEFDLQDPAGRYQMKILAHLQSEPKPWDAIMNFMTTLMDSLSYTNFIYKPDIRKPNFCTYVYAPPDGLVCGFVQWYEPFPVLTTIGKLNTTEQMLQYIQHPVQLTKTQLENVLTHHKTQDTYIRAKYKIMPNTLSMEECKFFKYNNTSVDDTTEPELSFGSQTTIPADLSNSEVNLYDSLQNIQWEDESIELPPDKPVFMWDTKAYHNEFIRSIPNFKQAPNHFSIKPLIEEHIGKTHGGVANVLYNQLHIEQYDHMPVGIMNNTLRFYHMAYMLNRETNNCQQRLTTSAFNRLRDPYYDSRMITNMIKILAPNSTALVPEFSVKQQVIANSQYVFNFISDVQDVTYTW